MLKYIANNHGMEASNQNRCVESRRSPALACLVLGYRQIREVLRNSQVGWRIRLILERARGPDWKRVGISNWYRWTNAHQLNIESVLICFSRLQAQNSGYCQNSFIKSVFINITKWFYNLGLYNATQRFVENHWSHTLQNYQLNINRVLA